MSQNNLRNYSFQQKNLSSIIKDKSLRDWPHQQKIYYHRNDVSHFASGNMILYVVLKYRNYRWKEIIRIVVEYGES